MSMRYCQACGTGHECEAEESGGEKAEVAIARLETNRDIEVARLTSAAGVKIADSEATHAAAHAEGMEEGIGAVLDAATPAAPETAGPPVVISSADPAEPEAVPDLTPPEVITPPAEETGGAGWWDGYR